MALIASMRMEMDPGTTMLDLGAGRMRAYKARPMTVRVSLEIVCEAKEAEVMQALMNGGEVSFLNEKQKQELEEAKQKCLDAVEELNLEKEYLEKKIDEVQGLTKRLLEEKK